MPPERRCHCDPDDPEAPDSCPLCRLVDAREAAKISGVSPYTIRGWVARGHLQIAGRIGRSPRFLEWDVLLAETATRERGGQHYA